MDDQARVHREAPAGADLLIRIGAAIIIADWLLFDIILDEYYFFTLTLLIALSALFAAWVRTSRPSSTWPLPYAWIMKLLGYTAGTLVLIEFIGDLRYGVLDNAGNILGGIVLYAGAFVMFWGARQLGSSTD
jgi:hypothetical protein